jgi:polyferredoxin
MWQRVFSLTTSAILFALGGACIIAYRVKGSTVDDAGVLREAFTFIPIGWLFIILGLLVVAGWYLRRCFCRRP